MDTLKTQRDLLSAGFSQEQADALVTAISKAHEDLVTKDFLRAELATRLSSLKTELICWMVGLLVIGVLIQKFLK